MTDIFDFEPKPLLFAVIGNPISHSKSPLVHSLFAKQFGIALEYHAIQVDVGGFNQAVDGFRANGGRGLNVTVPFKLNACQYAEDLSSRAQLAGAVNTLSFTDVVQGDNTDGIGLVTDIEMNQQVKVAASHVLVIGAGGAVRGILGPLLANNPASLVIANRTKDKSVLLAKNFSELGNVTGCGIEEVEARPYDIVINATSTGIAGELPNVSPKAVSQSQLVYDLMYGPDETPFMVWAKKCGSQTVADGLGMLVEQAAESFYIWHGKRPSTTSVIKAVKDELRSANVR